MIDEWAGLALGRPRIMGVLNVTPDSFSDGGRHAGVTDAVASALRMVTDGADIVDVGGESTRPGSASVPPEVEQQRIVPIITALAAEGVRVSVDTRNASTMAAALRAGAAIVNDVSGLTHDPDAAAVVAGAGCPVVLMHMRGTPADMRDRAVYADVVAEVETELRDLINRAVGAGIRREAIAIDPGIGFAKNAHQSTEMLCGLGRLRALGLPLLVGVSRKSFIGALTGEADPTQRLAGSLVAGLFALLRGAAILRVHDVKETRQAIRMWSALTSGPEHEAAPGRGTNAGTEAFGRGLILEAPGP